MTEAQAHSDWQTISRLQHERMHHRPTLSRQRY